MSKDRPSGLEMSAKAGLLEDLKIAGIGGTYFILLSGFLAGNKIVQEAKHLYYHLAQTPHQLITEDPEATFCYYSRDL